MQISLRGKQELIGKAEKQHIVLGEKKKKNHIAQRIVYGGGSHKMTKQLHTKTY